MSDQTPSDNEEILTISLNFDEVAIMKSILMAAKFSYYPRVEVMTSPLLNDTLKKLYEYLRKDKSHYSNIPGIFISDEPDFMGIEEIAAVYQHPSTEKYDTLLDEMMYPYTLTDEVRAVITGES